MAAPDADAPLRQPSHALPAAGAPTRATAAARLHEMLREEPLFSAAVVEIRAMDGLRACDWPPVADDGSDEYGFGRAQFMQQDGGGALLDHQLLSPDIESMTRHVRRAQRLQHPSCSRGDAHDATHVYERRRDAELESAVRRSVAHGASLLFLRDVVRQLPRRTISLDVPSRPPVLVWSDAAWEPDTSSPAAGGFVIIVPDEGRSPRRVLYALDTTDDAVLRRFVPGKKQYIGQLELLYAVAPYTSVPEVFAGRQVIHFIDNQSACAALVKGYARAVDSGLIVNAFHALNVALRADVFFEYVRSKANIADLPSRGDLVELLALFDDMGLHGEEVECLLPDLSAWDAPAREWMRAGRGEGAPLVKRPPAARGRA